MKDTGYIFPINFGLFLFTCTHLLILDIFREIQINKMLFLTLSSFQSKTILIKTPLYASL